MLEMTLVTERVSSSSSEQPTEVSLCHLTSNPVTTVPLGTLPVIVMVVDVTDVVSASTAAEGTVWDNYSLNINYSTTWYM